jgi:hypothetical protein
MKVRIVERRISMVKMRERRARRRSLEGRRQRQLRGRYIGVVDGDLEGVS